MKTLRLFISSPGDVGREREATRRVIDRLQSEFAEHVTLDPYFWEWEPVDFGQDYQSQIPSTADFDIVICLLWSKLGSRLGDQYKLPPDGKETASSGTQYELMQALHGKQQHPEKLPDLLVWVNKAPSPPAASPPLSRDQEDELIRQRRALQDFLATITRDTSTGIFTAAVNRYEVPGEDLGSYQYLDEFEDMMDKKLRKLIQKHIGQRTVKPKPQWPGSPFRDLDVFEFEHAPIFFGRSRAVGEVVRLLQNTLSKPQPCHFALILGASGSGKSSLARAGVLPLLTRPGVIEGIGLWRCAIVRPSDDSADLFQALAAALLSEGKNTASSEPELVSSRFKEASRLGKKSENLLASLNLLEITNHNDANQISAPNLFASTPRPPALPELADPESPNPQQSLAAELRAHPQTVAIRVKDQLHSVAKAHQTQQRHSLEAQIASLTQEGRQADAALKQQALLSLQTPTSRLVLLLDQMEELFTLNYAPEQLRAFLETIAVLARSGRVFVIGTLRSDFYPRYQEQPTLVALARDGARFDLLPPTPDEISQIIRRPASLAALQFEPHPTTAEHTLADTLRDEALTDTEALPLLEHVLNRLYQAQLPRADGRITFADYEDICGVDVDPKTHVKSSRGVGGALGKHAEDIFTGQNRKPTDPPPPWTEDTFRAVFRCLVTFGKGEGDTDVPNRRAFTYQDLIQSDPAAQALVDTFIHERLLIADTDAQSRPIVRLSHEALLTRWPRLSQWLQTAPVRDLMSMRRRIIESERQWREQNFNSDYLLPSGLRLAEGIELCEKSGASLSPAEKEFIQLSSGHAQQKEQAELSREIARRKELEQLLATSERMLDRSLFEEGRAWMERAKLAENQGDHFLALMLAGRAVGFQGYGRQLNETDATVGGFPLLLAKTMVDPKAEKERQWEIQDLARFIDKVRPTCLPLWTGAMENSVNCVAFSPDARHLACGSEDSTIKLWDTTTGKELATLTGHTRGVTSVAFSPDGNRIASSSDDSTIKLWDAASSKELISIAGHARWVHCVAFSPNGSQLTSCSTDETVKLWDTGSGKLLATLNGHTGAVRSVAFSPDGNRIASSSDDNSIKLWDAATGKEITSLSGHTWDVMSIAFSPDGTRIASASRDDTIKIWCTASSEKLVSIAGHTSWVHCVVFSPDGQRIASASRDNTVKLWDTASGKQLASISGHKNTVTSVAFNSDGTRLATGSIDRTINVWDAASGKELVSIFGHTDLVPGLAVSPDGSRIASGSRDTMIKLWDAASGKELTTLKGHGSWVGGLAFSPDGSRLASGSYDRTIKLWDTFSGKELATLNGHTGSVDKVAFGPGSGLLASSFNDHEIKLWDTVTGKELPMDNNELSTAKRWLTVQGLSLCPDPHRIVERDQGFHNGLYIVPANPEPDFTAPLRVGLVSFNDRRLEFPENNQNTPMLHVRQDTLAKLADPKLTPERRAELRMELCTKSSQFRAATALWQRLLQGEWPGFEGATVPKEQAPATIPADSPIRRLYLLALIDATKHPQIHGHPTICQTALQIAPVLTKEMMATPTISLAMMSLMQTLAKDDSPDMSAPRAALLKRLEEVATKEWLTVLRGE